jgi:hypothetical protein
MIHYPVDQLLGPSGMDSEERSRCFAQRKDGLERVLDVIEIRENVSERERIT